MTRGDHTTVIHAHATMAPMDRTTDELLVGLPRRVVKWSMSRPLASCTLAALLALPSGVSLAAARALAHPAVAGSAKQVYAGRNQYEGRQGVSSSPTASDARYELVAARWIIPLADAPWQFAEGAFSLPAPIPHRHQQTPAILAPLAPWLDVFMAQAQATGVPASLLAAVALVESGGNPWAQDPQGDVGLMQLQHGTARQMGVIGRRSPVASIVGGSRYLAWLGHLEGVTAACWEAGLRAGGACAGRIDEVLSHYNTGPSAHTYAAAYVGRVHARWSEIDAEERAA